MEALEVLGNKQTVSHLIQHWTALFPLTKGPLLGSQKSAKLLFELWAYLCCCQLDPKWLPISNPNKGRNTWESGGQWVYSVQKMFEAAFTTFIFHFLLPFQCSFCVYYHSYLSHSPCSQFIDSQNKWTVEPIMRMNKTTDRMAKTKDGTPNSLSVVSTTDKSPSSSPNRQNGF